MTWYDMTGVPDHLVLRLMALLRNRPKEFIIVSTEKFIEVPSMVFEKVQDQYYDKELER